MYDKELVSYFPVSGHIKSPRGSQVAVLNEVDRVIKNTTKKIIIIEAPVGSGKSPMALTLANAFGSAHILTPRKSLQDQYFEDFADYAVLMKGRSSYPCTMDASPGAYKKIAIAVKQGMVSAPRYGEPNCANAPCREDRNIYQICGNRVGTCPYTLAVETAQDHSSVIHNLHSFIFQTSFSEKFQKRNVIIIDEAHEVESTIRGFITKKFSVHIPVTPNDRPDKVNDILSWTEFLSQDRFVPKSTPLQKQMELEDPECVSPTTQYLQRVSSLQGLADFWGDKFSVKATINKAGRTDVSTTFEFTPKSLGNAPKELLFDFGEYVILMSGTIYDKGRFCNNLGINPDDAHFIRIPSTFPVENRPIYLKPAYQVDTSFQNWNENFDEMIGKIKKIMTIFEDAKGLIHAPSYDAAMQIAQALPGTRAVTHSSADFQEKLKEFYNSDEPLVFVSPVCQQGVDFKGDRARFQIVTRVPYLNTSDEFVNYNVKNDFPWYNYQALVVWGQQLGRVNRSEDDYGATFLLDSRFNSFISKNSKVIPKWIQSAFIR